MRLIILLGFLLLASPSWVWGLDLEEALRRGRLQWILLRADSLRTHARSLEWRGGPLPDPASIQTEWGQINSSLRDQAVQVNQNLRWPAYRTRHQEWTRTRWEGARLEQVRNLAELEAGIIRQFYRYLVAKARFELYARYDSLLVQNDAIFEHRYQQGQVSAAERNQWKLLRGEMALQWAEVRREQEEAARDFAFWTGSEELPSGNDRDLRWTMAPSLLPDSLNHPEVLRLHNQWQEARAAARLSQAQQWPGFSVGWRNMSIQGMGPDGLFYPMGRRFNTLQAGLSFPLRGKPWRLQAEADRRLAESAALHYQHGVARATNERKRDWERWRLLLEQWTYSSQNLIPLADTLQVQIQVQWAQGDLDLLQWSSQWQRILSTHNQHLDLTQQLNEATLQWHYPTNWYNYR